MKPSRQRPGPKPQFGKPMRAVTIRFPEEFYAELDVLAVIYGSVSQACIVAVQRQIESITPEMRRLSGEVIAARKAVTP